MKKGCNNAVLYDLASRGNLALSHSYKSEVLGAGVSVKL